MILQWLGGYSAQRAYPGIWYDEPVGRSKSAKQEGSELCVVSGLRFLSDAVILRKAGAVVARIERPEAPKSDLHNVTEREAEKIPVDTTIVNNGNLDNLRQVATRLYKDLQAFTLQSTYYARPID